VKVGYRKSFSQDLRKIRDDALLQRIRRVIEDVKTAETMLDIAHLSKMSGTSGFYRIRVGSYRLGVAIVGDEIEFVRCLDRRDVYRHFP